MREYIIVAMPVVLIILLMIGSVTDLKSHTVPLWLSAVGFGIKGIELAVLEPNNIKSHLLFAFLLFGVLFTNVILGGLGGADSMLGAMCGIYLGIFGVYAVMVAFLFSLPHAAYAKKRKDGESREYPFIPYLLLGVCVVYMFFLSKKRIYF